MLNLFLICYGTIERSIVLSVARMSLIDQIEVEAVGEHVLCSGVATCEGTNDQVLYIHSTGRPA